MAVYTPLSREEIEELLAHYSLGALVEFKGIAEGVENTNYLLTLQSGRRAILTIFERRVRAEDLPFFMQLKQHLAARGCVCPQSYPDAEGNLIRTLKGKPAALISFLEGKGVMAPKQEHCAALGAEMARMHLAVADFPLNRDNALAPDRLSALYEKTAPHLDSLQPGLRERLAEEMEVMRRWPSLNLPRGVIHADLFPDNVFFSPLLPPSGLTRGSSATGLDARGKPEQGMVLSGIIDFYFACTDYFAYDLAIALNAWCFDAGHRYLTEQAQALIAAYVAVRPLSADEHKALAFLARGASLRFLMTRAHDWFFPVKDATVTPKDPLEYLLKWEYFQEHSRKGEP